MFWFCFKILIVCLLCFNLFVVNLLRFELNCVNDLSFLYDVKLRCNVLVIFFIVLICVDLLIWDIDCLVLIVGFIFEKNKLDCKKICLFVIEIMFVGI